MAKDAQEKPNFKSGILNFFAFFCQNYTQRNLASEDDNSVIHYLDENSCHGNSQNHVLYVRFLQYYEH